MPAFSNSPWSSYSPETSANTAEVILKWDANKKKFLGLVQLWSFNPPVEIEVDYIAEKYIEIDRWIVYLSYDLGWQTQEAIAIAKNKNTLRYKGWCIIHLNSSFVDFYDMEESTETVRMTVEEFGENHFYYGHSENDNGRYRQKFVDCCHDCF